MSWAASGIENPQEEAREHFGSERCPERAMESPCKPSCSPVVIPCNAAGPVAEVSGKGPESGSGNLLSICERRRSADRFLSRAASAFRTGREYLYCTAGSGAVKVGDVAYVAWDDPLCEYVPRP